MRYDPKILSTMLVISNIILEIANKKLDAIN